MAETPRPTLSGASICTIIASSAHDRPYGTPARRAPAPGARRMGHMSTPPAFAAPPPGLLGRAPRGYWGGVERAIDIVEVALATYGPPVYVRKQIVHNLHVVRDLETRGAVF